MGNEEDRISIAELKTRMEQLERDVEDIKIEQKSSRDDRQTAALREKDLGTQMLILSNNIRDHIAMHEKESSHKVRLVDVVIAIGVLVASGFSAYGAVAMIAITKTMGK